MSKISNLLYTKSFFISYLLTPDYTIIGNNFFLYSLGKEDFLKKLEEKEGVFLVSSWKKRLIFQGFRYPIRGYTFKTTFKNFFLTSLSKNLSRGKEPSFLICTVKGGFLLFYNGILCFLGKEQIQWFIPIFFSLVSKLKISKPYRKNLFFFFLKCIKSKVFFYKFYTSVLDTYLEHSQSFIGKHLKGLKSLHLSYVSYYPQSVIKEAQEFLKERKREEKAVLNDNKKSNKKIFTKKPIKKYK